MGISNEQAEHALRNDCFMEVKWNTGVDKAPISHQDLDLVGVASSSGESEDLVGKLSSRKAQEGGQHFMQETLKKQQSWSNCLPGQACFTGLAKYFGSWAEQQ